MITNMELGTLGEWVSSGGTIVLGIAALRATRANDRQTRQLRRMDDVRLVELSIKNWEPAGMTARITNRGPFKITDVVITVTEGARPPKDHSQVEVMPGDSMDVGIDEDFGFAGDYGYSTDEVHGAFTYLDGSRWLLNHREHPRLHLEAPGVARTRFPKFRRLTRAKRTDTTASPD